MLPALSVLCHALYLILGLLPWVKSGLVVRIEYKSSSGELYTEGLNDNPTFHFT